MQPEKDLTPFKAPKCRTEGCNFPAHPCYFCGACIAETSRNYQAICKIVVALRSDFPRPLSDNEVVELRKQFLKALPGEYSVAVWDEENYDITIAIRHPNGRMHYAGTIKFMEGEVPKPPPEPTKKKRIKKGEQLKMF